MVGLKVGRTMKIQKLLNFSIDPIAFDFKNK